MHPWSALPSVFNFCPQDPCPIGPAHDQVPNIQNNKNNMLMKNVSFSNCTAANNLTIRNSGGLWRAGAGGMLVHLEAGGYRNNFTLSQVHMSECSGPGAGGISYVVGNAIMTSRTNNTHNRITLRDVSCVNCSGGAPSLIPVFFKSTVTLPAQR